MHSNYFSFYCKKCQKNLRIYCNTEHKYHYVINLTEFNHSEEPKNKPEETIKNIEKKSKDSDNIKQDTTSKTD